MFLPQIVEVRGIRMGVNYGTDKVRFPSPVPVGSRIRGNGELVAAGDTKDGAVQATVRVTVEIEGRSGPPASSTQSVAFILSNGPRHSRGEYDPRPNSDGAVKENPRRVRRVAPARISQAATLETRR